MIFHEEAAFRHSKELPNDPEESPPKILDSPHSENQREEKDEPSMSVTPLESERREEDLLKAPP